jgi:pyruvate/2-oxoglutarate dehydrogenase complex dihydrolipoamide acyltransferase (E2) component
MSSLPTDSAEHGFVHVTLPELGANLLEAIVVGWEKHPGEWVDTDETICIVSADGLRAGVASSASGYLVRLLAGVGARIGPGTSLAEIAIPLAGAEGGPPEPVEDTDGGPTEPKGAQEEPSQATPTETFSPLDAQEPAPAPSAEPMEMSSFHSPAVKRLAEEHGIDLALVSGTAAGGRISREDVLAHLEQVGEVRGGRSIAEDAPGARTT